MYGVYNAETLENLANTLDKMDNKTIWYEKLFVDKLIHWFN